MTSNRRNFLIRAFVLLACSFGCRTPLTQSETKLVGGKLVPEKMFDATFFLRSNCTATKVGKNVILTAAHCVVSRPFKDIKPQFLPAERVPLELVLQKEVSRDDTSRDVLVDIKDTVVFPTYWDACQKICDGDQSVAFVPPNPKDVAAIVVQLPNPQFEAIPIAPLASRPVATGAPLIISGYGCEQGSNMPDESTVRFKYKELTPLLAPDFMASPLITLESKATLAQNFHLTPGQNWQVNGRELGESSASLCPGDSGGPLYVQAEPGLYAVAGINSFMLPPDGDAAGISAINFHTKVDGASSKDVEAWLKPLLIGGTSPLLKQPENPARDKEPLPEKECRYCRFTFDLSGPLLQVDPKTSKTLPRNEWDLVFEVHSALKKAGIRSWVYSNSVEVSKRRKKVWLNVKILNGGETTRSLEKNLDWKVPARTFQDIFAKQKIRLKSTASYIEILSRYKKPIR